jgi:hypothetical protein
MWYDGPGAVNNAIGYAPHYSRSHDAVIRVYDDIRNVIETHEHKGDFKGGVSIQCCAAYRGTGVGRGRGSMIK